MPYVTDTPSSDSLGFLMNSKEEAGGNGYGTSFEIAEMWRPTNANHEHKAARRAMVLSAVFYVVPALVCMFGAVQLFKAINHDDSFTNHVPDDSARLSELSVSFSLSNDYGPCEMLVDGPVVEPHRMTTLVATLHGAGNDEFARGDNMVWRVDGVEVHRGNQLQHLFREVRPHQVVLSLQSDELAIQASTNVDCRYVRRDVRMLTDTDRDAFFASLGMVYNVSTHDGRGLFGDRFVDIHDLVKWRLERSVEDGCNGMTRGAGVHTQHAALAMALEAALQTVNPSVSLPYWDLAFDASAYGGEDWHRSGVFAEHLFGATQSSMVTPQVMGNAEEFSAEHNAFGMLRPSWNNNPSPDVERMGVLHGDSGPSCASLQACLASSALSTLNACLDWYSYNALSVAMGGLGTAETETTAVDADDAAVDNFLFEELVKRDFIDCAEMCKPGDECACSLSTDMTTILDVASGRTAGAAAAAATAKRANVSLLNLPDFARRSQNAAAAALSNLDVQRTPGDINSPVAPYDPVFWVLTAGTERLFQQRLFLADAALAGEEQHLPLDLAWGYADSSGWEPSVCSSDNLCSTGLKCPGHALDDAAGPVLTVAGGAPTNEDLLALMKPDNTQRP